jgi:hypothetical protein
MCALMCERPYFNASSRSRLETAVDASRTMCLSVGAVFFLVK